MSERASSTAKTEGPVTLETGLESFQSSPEFRGPVEDLDGHDCNDHFAQIYETRTEKFEAAIPFVRHGLYRGERIAYVVDQSTETEVRTALRDAGIDVEAALDSGALTFYTVDETYLRDGTFDPDEMIQFYADATAEATEDFEALRLVAEMSWIETDDTTVEELMEYESKINDLFDSEDVLAICQYDRKLFAPEVINNIVRTHPHLIYNGAVCHNFYYTPPEELFGDDNLAQENERMLRTLQDRATAKAELQQRDRFLRDIHAIAADQTKAFEEKLDEMFELGCEQFNLDYGFLNRVDPDADHLEVEHASDDHDHYKVGSELPLSETYCQAAVDIKEAATVSNPAEEGFDDHLVYEEFGVDGYLGTYIPVEGGMDRTLAFVPDGSHEEPFSEQNKAYLDLMGQWVGYELNRRQREQFLRRCHELTADPELDFEEKLHRLLDLARNRMGFDAAGLTHLPEWDGQFLTEYAIGYGDGDGGEVITASDGVWTDPGEGCYCRQAITADEPVGKADVRGTDWEGDEIHQEHGLMCYFGTKVMSGSTPYGTLWVGGTEPRDRGLSETERTFLELMSQWISYEIERRQHHEAQQRLYEITSDPDSEFAEKIDALFELGSDQFGLDIGGMATVYPDDDQLEVEYVSEEYGNFAPGLEPPLSGTYFGAAHGSDGPVTIIDPVAEDYDGYAYHELGFEAYLGTHVEVDGGRDRLFFFTTAEPRDHEFSDAELTFIDLLGQWVQYELERQQREQELERTLDLLEKTEQVADVGGWEIDPETQDVFWSDYLHELLEVDSDEEPPLDEALDLYLDSDQKRVEDAIETALTTGESFDVEARIQTCNDEVRWLRIQGVPETVDGEVVSLRGAAQDITDRKTHEAQLEHKNDRLESFASMLAHELRNPVTIGQIYSDQLPDETDSEATAYVTEAFDRIEDMIDVLLILTRGREAVDERAPVDLAAVADKAWGTVDAPDATLDIELDHTIEADETYVRHLFQNLLENAVEHGGADVTVTIGELDDGFYVADDGTGIPPEEQDAVFDEGYTTASDNGGTGLGLAFVEKLADVYDWDLAVTDSENDGAQFEFQNVG